MAQPDPNEIEVVNPTGRRAVRVPGHGTVAASGRPHTVELNADVEFLLEVGALERFTEPAQPDPDPDHDADASTGEADPNPEED